MKTGVMGGTFDPVHLGHLAVAAKAHQQLNLSELVFMPAGHPYFKAAATVTPARHRVKMLELAIGNKPGYRISLLEVGRQGPSYAVDSMAKMKQDLTLADELYFILGWDSFLSLPLWHEADRLIQLCRIVAAPRPGYPHPDMDKMERQLPGISRRVIILEGPLVDISATVIRDRIRRGLPVDDMVPPAVGQYILAQGLYTDNNRTRLQRGSLTEGT